MSKSRVELCKKMKNILGNLQIYVNNIDIHKFGIKLKGRKICIYAFVDFESKTLYKNLRQLFIDFHNYEISLKEYVYPLDDKYNHILDKIINEYNDKPFLIKLMGKTVKTMYLKKIINANYFELPYKTKKTIIYLITHE